MYSGFAERFVLFARRFLGESEEDITPNDERKELEDVVELAKQEWLAASRISTMLQIRISGPCDLVGSAAERKYMYWLKQAKTVHERMTVNDKHWCILYRSLP